MDSKSVTAWIARIFALAPLACGGAEQRSTTTPEEKEETRMPEVETIHALAAAEAEALGVPGMAVGLIRNGELVSVRGHGVLAERIDADTVFRIGSITKVFTAMAATRLRDEGKLSFDDPVARHLPELEAVLSPDGTEPVRVRHLLQHSSGIPTLGDGSLDWTRGTPITEEQLLASAGRVELLFLPGTRFDYSNVGMALAGLVVARASGTSYRRCVDEKILAPLNMQSTRWDRDDYPAKRVFPGHVRARGAFATPPHYWVLGAIEPAGGLYSTVGDMARFLGFQVDPATAPDVLAAASVVESQRAAKTPGVPIGIGWVVQEDADLETIVWHNGATYSYGAWAGIDPKRKNGAIVFVSTGDVRVLERAERVGMDALRVLAGLEARHTAEAARAGEPTDPELVAEVARRVMALLNAPESASYEEIFSSSFLAQQPAEKLRQFLVAAHGQIGTCESYELEEDDGGGQFVVRMVCAGTNVDVSVAAQLAPPHLLDGIMIEPAN